jgi:hypothetical protein
VRVRQLNAREISGVGQTDKNKSKTEGGMKSKREKRERSVGWLD